MKCNEKQVIAENSLIDFAKLLSLNNLLIVQVEKMGKKFRGFYSCLQSESHGTIHSILINARTNKTELDIRQCLLHELVHAWQLEHGQEAEHTSADWGYWREKLLFVTGIDICGETDED